MVTTKKFIEKELKETNLEKLNEKMGYQEIKTNKVDKILKDVGYKKEIKIKDEKYIDKSSFGTILPKSEDDGLGKSVLTIQENKKAMLSYIFDESQVLKNKVFTQLKLVSNSFAYGLLLPKEIPTHNKRNEIVGHEQVWSPVLITSDRKLIEATKEVERKYKIKFEAVPTNLPLRWSLESIKKYLEGNDEAIPELSPEELADKIKALYEKFCFFRELTWYKVNTLWDTGTYFFDLFDNFPIKEERGLQGTGKTKSMKISRNITFNATDIMINPSEATLFRETHDKRPTKFIDEAEKLFTFRKGLMEADNRVELINGSYSKGSSIPRIEKVGNRFICVYYQVYSPTRVGSINGLFGATESRSITQVHTRSPDADKRGETEPQDNDSEFQMIRDYLYLFGLKYWKNIEDNYKDDSIYEGLKLKKRDLQIWKPLLAIAKTISDDWFDEVSSFAEKLSSQRKEDFITEDSWDYRILEIIKKALDVGQTIIRPKEIRGRYKEKYDLESERLPHEKTITTHLDKMGFRELRQPKDREGVSYLITKENFTIIVSPICPDLTNYSSHSSHSSQSLINTKNSVTNSDDSVTNSDEFPIEKIEKCDECDSGDANDEETELKEKKNE